VRACGDQSRTARLAPNGVIGDARPPPRYAAAVIDLHSHSTCSDGSDAPERLARLAADTGLAAVALTDHDTVEGFGAFAAAASALGVRPVRGAEISCLEEGRSVHVLCYFVSEDPQSSLRGLLASLSGDRDRRNAELAAKLQALGYERITLHDVAAAAGPDTASLGRPHFADALLRNYPGEFASRQDVFDQLLGSSGRAYVPKSHVPVAAAAAAARLDGAVTVLAHPLITFLAGSSSEDRTLPAIEAALDPILARLAAEGLVGLECYYPRHDRLETELLIELARRHGLAVTGGSDYHGDKKADLSLGTGTGSLAVPDELLDALEARRP